jgi:DNA-binding NtrC family response regulator
MKSILIASGNPKACEAIRDYFVPEHKVILASAKDSCLDEFRKKRHEFTFIDVELLRALGHGEGLHRYTAGLKPFRQAFPAAEIIVLSSQQMIREAVNAVKAGASDYLTFPINRDELQHVIENILESIRLRSELYHFRDSFWESESLEIVQTISPSVKGILDKALSVAPTKSTVLLTGETGTGKGLMAKFIHLHSQRKTAQFINVHCGAIPDTLLESELFGHEKGAFTGADRRKLGKFEIANGGTIFLDEIGTLTPSAQIKLLKVLQDKTFQRVGGVADIESDVRIIAATNADLKKLCNDGLFRNDLYYRLSVFPIEILPLRERREDIPLLVEFFLKKMNKYYSKEINQIHPKVLEAFARYSWPGNIRELENLIERACILETFSMLTPERFPREFFNFEGADTQGPPVNASFTLAEVRRRGIENVERDYLRELLAVTKGKIQKTAEAAGVTSRQLNKLMNKYGIRKEEFKR